MASSDAILKCFTELRNAGIPAPPGWANTKLEVIAKSDAWMVPLREVRDDQLAAAALAWITRPRHGFPVRPSDLLGIIVPATDDNDHHAAAEAALMVLRARATRWQTDPVSPSDPDCEIVEPVPVMVRDRFNGNCLRPVHNPDGSTRMTVRNRADGRWRVAGDAFTQTDVATERAVWAVLEALGGIWPLRDVLCSEDRVQWTVYLRSWRSQWMSLAKHMQMPSTVQIGPVPSIPPRPAIPERAEERWEIAPEVQGRLDAVLRGAAMNDRRELLRNIRRDDLTADHIPLRRS